MADTTPTPDPEKLRRERELLLADMDVAPLVNRLSRAAEMEALLEMNHKAVEDLSVRDELKPYTGPARPDEDPSWLDAPTHDLETALRLAREAAPRIVVAGRSAADEALRG